MTAQPSEPPGDPQLGTLIREQMRRRRLTVNELAALMGVHRSTLSRWLKGWVCPSPAHLTKLEEALGVTLTVDADGFQALDPAPADVPAPEPAPAPQVVVVVAGTAEAMREVLDRLGVPRGE